MNDPKSIHERNAGEVQPLPENLRDLLLKGKGASVPDASEDLPGVPAYPRYKNKTDVPASPTRNGLTNRQKQVLCQIAAAAYEVQRKHGLIDDGVKLEAWRRAEQLAAVGVGSLTKCRQAHYLPLKGHFEALAGIQNAETLQKLVAQPDDPDRQLVSKLIAEEVERFAELVEDHQGKKMGWRRAEAYARKIARDRGYVGPDLLESIRETWAVPKLWGLLNTLRNRTNAKRGVGDTRRRNKGQRGARETRETRE
jgi:hypothetical protein